MGSKLSTLNTKGNRHFGLNRKIATGGTSRRDRETTATPSPRNRFKTKKGKSR